MSGFFGVASEENCVSDVFYGTDYHLHLGTRFGGMVTYDSKKNLFHREIKKLGEHTFRSQLEDYVAKTSGNIGLGVISDYEEQPLISNSGIGKYFITHVGKINNIGVLADEVKKKGGGFSEMVDEIDDEVNPTELVAKLIDQGKDIVDGIQTMQSRIDGSCSLMLLTREGIYVARDRLGRTPVVIGRKNGSTAASLESHAFLNLGFDYERQLGPAEIGIITPEGYKQLSPPKEDMQICAFLWVYYGYPASIYEGKNVEVMRNSDGKLLAIQDRESGFDASNIDIVAGIPDSGTGHAIGYANEIGADYARPFVKYTPSWPRSFMPQDQKLRELVAKMKLLPVRELIKGKRILFCEDSIVRGTQLTSLIEMLYDKYDAREIHMRPGCPPLIHMCKFLNFSRSGSDSKLATAKVTRRLERGKTSLDILEYIDENSSQHQRMVDEVAEDLGVTSLRYQTMTNMIQAIGLPKEKLCTYCWDGCEGCK